MKPIIGVTTSFGPAEGNPSRLRATINAAYTDAIFAAGGIPQPIAIPPTLDDQVVDELLARCDGLLFTGGEDLNPRHYGQDKHERTHVLHERRDNLDIELFRRADEAGLPILSICLGCQIANVARGGCLVQHVDDVPRTGAIEHHKPDHGSAYHEVQVDPESRLAKITGKTHFEVNSRHHQVLDRKQVGGRLRAVAFAPDGVVEAAEDTDGRFLVAVQWHPEDMTDRAEHRRLFEALVEEAGRRAKRV